ncbi:MAG: type II toxin-antitoxin system VapC family toxin, partial [Terriglobia bacterium]
MAAVLDTHAAIWYLLRSKELSPTALRSIRQAVGTGYRVYLSAISMVEVIYLVERGRVPLHALQKLEAALNDPASGLVVAPVEAAVAGAVKKVSRDSVA